jgi:DNA helicase HerA-like ATPase
MVIVGASGSGKTVLERAVINELKPRLALVIDPKCTWGGTNGPPGYSIIRDPSLLGRLKRDVKRILYRPGPELHTTEAWDAVYRWAYYRGDLLVCTDEAFATMRGTHSPDWQRACITSGRELGVAMITCTQRPRGVDQRLLSESEIHVAFRLRKLDDRKAMEDYIGPSIFLRPPKYAFWAMREEWDQPALMRLKLEGG